MIYPYSIRSSTSFITSLMGMAKPMPSMDAPEEVEPEYFAVVMPTTSPFILKSGPPELPELMAASVWSILMMVRRY